MFNVFKNILSISHSLQHFSGYFHHLLIKFPLLLQNIGIIGIEQI